MGTGNNETYICLYCNATLNIDDRESFSVKAQCALCDIEYGFIYKNEPLYIRYFISDTDNNYYVEYIPTEERVACWGHIEKCIIYENKQSLISIKEADYLRNKITDIKVFL